MSEYELEELLTSASLAAVEGFTVYLSVTTAYLIAAYLVGRQLTPMQIFIVNTLYIVAGLIMTWSTFGYATRAIAFADALEVMNPDRRYGAQPIVRTGIALVQTLGILASLKFMWDVRHPKTD